MNEEERLALLRKRYEVVDDFEAQLADSKYARRAVADTLETVCKDVTWLLSLVARDHALATLARALHVGDEDADAFFRALGRLLKAVKAEANG